MRYIGKTMSSRIASQNPRRSPARPTVLLNLGDQISLKIRLQSLRGLFTDRPQCPVFSAILLKAFDIEVQMPYLPPLITFRRIGPPADSPPRLKEALCGRLSRRHCICGEAAAEDMGGHSRLRPRRYSGRNFYMSLKNILGCSLISAALIIFGYFYLDTRLAEFVSEEVGSDFLLSEQVSNLPDLLLLLVIIITVVSWTGRLYLAAKHVNGPILNSLEYIGLAVPVAFISKHFLKQLFGRMNSRMWILHPDQFGFNWFQGGGDFSSFSSGHMAVITVLMLGIGRYFTAASRMRNSALCPCSGLDYNRISFFQ